MKAFLALFLVCVLSVQGANLRAQVSDNELFGTPEQLLKLTALLSEVSAFKNVIHLWKHINIFNGENVTEAVDATFSLTRAVLKDLDNVFNGEIAKFWAAHHINLTEIEHHIVGLVHESAHLLNDKTIYHEVLSAWRSVDWNSGANLEQAFETTYNASEVILNFTSYLLDHELFDLFRASIKREVVTEIKAHILALVKETIKLAPKVHELRHALKLWKHTNLLTGANVSEAINATSAAFHVLAEQVKATVNHTEYQALLEKLRSHNIGQEAVVQNAVKVIRFIYHIQTEQWVSLFSSLQTIQHDLVTFNIPSAVAEGAKIHALFNEVKATV